MTNWKIQDDEFCFHITCNGEIRASSVAGFLHFIQKIAIREIGRDTTLYVNEIASGSLFGRIKVRRRDVVDAAVVGGFIIMLGSTILDLIESSKSPNYFWKQLPEIIQTDGVRSFEFESRNEKVKITRDQIIDKLVDHSEHRHEIIALDQSSDRSPTQKTKIASGHFVRLGKGHYIFATPGHIFSDPLICPSASQTLYEGKSYQIEYYELQQENRIQTIVKRILK